VTTNTVEGYSSIFKLGMKSVDQRCEKKQSHRYAAEFAFRYNIQVGNGVSDAQRAGMALVAVAGKRLT
jgi:hypothetical protein